MQLEKLRKSHKRKIIIGGLIIVYVISAITITTTRAKYKVTEDIPLVRGNVNYKVSDMRVVALYIENDNGEYVENNDIPKSGYQLSQEKSMCRVYDGSTSVENAPKDEKVTINYHDGVIGFDNITKKNTRCYLYFDKKQLTGSETILQNITVNSGTPNFSNTATIDEGVYSVSDPVYGGTSYYWRGAVTNNYVKFGGFCWRIIRINGDGSMRLIYDGTACHANGTNAAESIATRVKYNTQYNNSSHVGWTYKIGSQRTLSGTSSNAKTQLESWYNSNLASQASKIADGKYCNDRNVQSGQNWTATGSDFYYASYTRRENNSPSLACNSGDVYTLKVGLITSDEVIYAGGRAASNTSYYLYNGQSYWTMSPKYWDGVAFVFCVDSDGYLDRFRTVGSAFGLRPVINLKADTLFAAGGNGTLENPYVVI